MVDIPVQLEKLKSRDAAERYDACTALEQAPSLPRTAVEALRLATCDADPRVATAARNTLQLRLAPTGTAVLESLPPKTDAKPRGEASSRAGFAIALLILLVGAFGVLSRGWHLAERLGLSPEMVRTTGTVVGIRTTSEDGEIFVVEVVTEKGTFTTEMSCGLLACFERSDIGMRVPVLYPRSQPGTYGAILPDSPQGWLGDVSSLGIAAIMMIGALVYLSSFTARRA